MSYQKVLNDFCEGMHTGVTDVGKYAPVMFSIVDAGEIEFFKLVRELRRSAKYPVFTSVPIPNLNKKGKYSYIGLIGLYEDDAFYFRLSQEVNKIDCWSDMREFNLLVKRIE